jgi:hypothetical protein
MNRILLSLSRFLTVLGAGAWIGGLAFFGAVAAPIISRTDRSLLFVLVAPMLGRFATVTYVCGALMLLGWLGERYLANGVTRRNAPWWWLQGVGTVAMLAIALYLGQVLMPQIKELQRDLKKPASIIGMLEDRLLKNRGDRDGSSENKNAFDAAHERYTQLAQATLFLGLGTLFVFCWRICGRTLEPGQESGDDAAASGPHFDVEPLAPSGPRR